MFSLEERLKQANATLAPYAIPYDGKLGRQFPENPDETRFPFQRDRDRILHAHAFRRLQGKTQVFMVGEGDHFRTRLTHTMEVAQIARDIARALALNEDLTECIALAHDLGHPPFGHAGEEALDAWMRERGKHFEHNEQSFRIVTVLEKHSSQYTGLNLNREVEEGLLKHDKDIHPSLEAQVANIADEIAYTSHDSDDGLLADFFSLEELKQISLVARASERTAQRGTYIRGSLVHLLVRDLLDNSLDQLGKGEMKIALTEAMRNDIKELRAFLATHMYFHPKVQERMREGQQMVDMLCRFYVDHPIEKMANIQERTGCDLPEAVKDYVAGMTDNFAWLQAAELGLLPLDEGPAGMHE